MLSFDLETQRFVLMDSTSGMRWHGQLNLESAGGCHRFEPGSDDGLLGRAGPWEVSLQLEEVDGLSRLAIRVAVLPGQELKRVYVRLEPFSAAAAESAGLSAMVLAKGLQAARGIAAVEAGEQRDSQLMTLVRLNEKAGAYLLAGIDRPHEDASQFLISHDWLEAGFRVDRAPAGDQTYAFVFATGSAAAPLLDGYGKHLKQHARPTLPRYSGWNSWDYYGGAVSMDDLHREMDALERSPLRESVEAIVIDMGWESAWGDWVPNRKFPATLREIAEAIEARGFMPGIWTAPLLASPWAPLARHRQDLLVRDARGGLAFAEDQVILDFNQDEVLDQLHAWFAAMADAGFRIFKLDYIYQSAIDQFTPTPEHGRIGLVRRGLETIRRAVGDEAHILNCGAPMEAALGITDSTRICNDIHTFWGHILVAANQIPPKFWQSERLWRIDPDFAVIRSERSTDDPFRNYPHEPKELQFPESFWMAGPEATDAELRTWLTMVRLTGGQVNLADSISRLNTYGIDLLAKLFPPLTGQPQALDLFENNPPRMWLNRSDTESWLGLFNWSDEPRPIELPTGLELPQQAVDWWTDQPVRLTPQTILPPHGSVLVRL